MAEVEKVKRRRFTLRRKPKQPAGGSMTVMEHLGELRSRIFKSLFAFVAISVVVFIMYEPIADFIRQPLCENIDQIQPDNPSIEGCRLAVFKPTGGFNFRLKLTAIVGIGLSSPIWLYQLWAYIVPALTRREKKYALPFLLSAVLLFLIGVAMAYLTLPTGLRVLFSLGGESVEPILGAEEYLDFIGFLLLGFGLMFELPLVLVFLGLAGVVTPRQLRKQRRLAIVLIFALAAIVTPSQDPYTMSVMAIPLYGLYEMTILIVSVMLRRRAREEGST
jgi:sec-independent protein translocase protein TatC